MAISYVGAGSNSRSLIGNVSPPLPSGWQPGDIFICIIASLDNSISTMPSGWTAIGNTGTNNGSGFRTTTFYKISVTGDKSPLVTHSGSFIEATIVAYRGVDTDNPFDAIGNTSINPYSTTVKATSITTITDSALVIFTGSITSRSAFSNYSGTPTPTERIDVPNAANYPSTFVADFSMSPAGNTGDRTCAATTAGVNNGLMFALKPPTGTIICITDPSDANIYIDGFLQPVNTSTSIIVTTGNHNVTFSKAGYYPYATTVLLTNNQIINVCAILTQIVNITSYGIVICTNPNISSCPITPLGCPISVSPLNYVNFIAILDSGSSITLTVNFNYTINNTTYILSIPVNLLIGTNIIYAFPTNVQYPPNTNILLTSVRLS